MQVILSFSSQVGMAAGEEEGERSLHKYIAKSTVIGVMAVSKFNTRINYAG